jgi:hypothetical protein
LISSTKTNISWTRDKSSTSTLGIWTKFVEYLGLSLGLQTTRTAQDIFRFERVHTEEFFPDEAYLSAALHDRRVQRALAAGRRDKVLGRAVGSKGVYVIVGVKTVSGAQVKSVMSRRDGVQATVAVDAAVVGSPVPVVVGAVGGVRWERGESTEFEGSDDFVFAYRVQKVSLTWKGVERKDYSHGVMLGIRDDERTVGEVGAKDVVVDDLGGEDVDDTWSGRQVVDGKEEVEVFVPRVVRR